MKRTLLALLVAGLMVTTANAATLEMQFAGGGHEITANVGETITVEIWFNGMVAGDSLSTVFHKNNPVPELTQTSSNASLANWSAGGVDADLGNNQFAVGADNPTTDSISGPGSVLVGLQTIVGTVEGDYDLMFEPAGVFAQVLNAGGGGYTYWGSDGGWAGYYSYGKGAPVYAGNPKTGDPAQAADPLLIHIVPEPGTLAMLALGGLALIRRR